MVDKRPTSNSKMSLDLIQLAVHLDQMAYHAADEAAKWLLQNEGTTPRFMMGGGVCTIIPPKLADGEACALRMSNEGRLLVDTFVAVSATVWTHKYFQEVAVTNVDQTINFGFSAKYVCISNDDTTNAVYFNYDAAATVLTDKLLATEVYEDQYQATNIHLLGAVAGPTTVRVWARA